MCEKRVEAETEDEVEGDEAEREGMQRQSERPNGIRKKRFFFFTNQKKILHLTKDMRKCGS